MLGRVGLDSGECQRVPGPGEGQAVEDLGDERIGRWIAEEDEVLGSDVFTGDIDVILDEQVMPP